MQPFDEGRGLWSDESRLGLSARRIWEHIHLGQANPFAPIALAVLEDMERVMKYVDVVDLAHKPATLTGLTLGDVYNASWPTSQQSLYEALAQVAADDTVDFWLKDISDQFGRFITLRGRRNSPAAFLPSDADGALGIRGLRSALVEWLRARTSERKLPAEWLGQILNLRNSGLKTEELESSGICRTLELLPATKVAGGAVLASIDFGALRLSIRPVVHAQGAQLNFVPMHEGALIPSANSKARKALGARTILRERAMGYTIETREWSDLFGRAQCWAAFTHQGELLTSTNAPQGLCTSLKDAMSLASVHAEASLPRVSSLGRWSEHRQTGGQHYREWLITLPYFHRTFYSTHFEHRNVLIHVRCDIREGDNGQNVLVLHEIQSDWAQHARKQTDQQSNSQTGIVQPPWSAEWPALALKLMLLHAIQQGVAAMAWTRAEVQVKRWNKLGAAGLRELYDRTLPRECNRLLQPFDRRCEEIDVFQPTNYCIDPSEDGYLVYDGNGEHIADCATWQEALCAIPCGSIDELQPMHGVRIDEALRLAITEKGLSAWGNGVR